MEFQKLTIGERMVLTAQLAATQHLLKSVGEAREQNPSDSSHHEDGSSQRATEALADGARR